MSLVRYHCFFSGRRDYIAGGSRCPTLRLRSFGVSGAKQFQKNIELPRNPNQTTVRSGLAYSCACQKVVLNHFGAKSWEQLNALPKLTTYEPRIGRSSFYPSTHGFREHHL